MTIFLRGTATCFAVAALFLAACSNGGSPPTSVQVTCLPVSWPIALQMVYPENGATGVPDVASVVVYSPNLSGSPIPLALGISAASPVALQPTAVPSPGPTPSEAPIAGRTEYAAALPTLQPATNYTIYAIQTLRTYSNCAGTSSGPWPVGSFTTQ
jgi:hypothetical protein